MLKEQVEALIHENAVLKRAVSIQHERQKEFDDRGQELHHLKQMVSQYQEQLRTLEVKIPNPEISGIYMQLQSNVYLDIQFIQLWL